MMMSGETRGTRVEKVPDLDAPPGLDHWWWLDCSSYFGV